MLIEYDYTGCSIHPLSKAYGRPMIEEDLTDAYGTWLKDSWRGYSCSQYGDLYERF